MRLLFYYIIFTLFFCNTIYSYAQNAEEIEAIKKEIEEFQKAGDIVSINRLINKNTFLDPEYALQIINKNIASAHPNKLYFEQADSYLTLGNFWFTKGNKVKAYENYLQTKNQQLKEELLNEKVKFSQEHLISFANQVNKVEFFIERLKSEMKQLTSTGKLDNETINSLKISFADVLINQNELKQINAFSNELNQDFFFHVKKQYPEVTKEDEQLLNYLLHDVSAKEIGRNLSISTDSVYKKRYRLRKKLNLRNEETFADFFNKITKKTDE